MGGKLEELETVCGPLIDFLGDEKNVNELVREKSVNLVSIQKKTSMDLSAFNIDYLFAYARLRYEVGFYQHTDILLNYYRMLTPDISKKMLLYGVNYLRKYCKINGMMHSDAFVIFAK